MEEATISLIALYRTDNSNDGELPRIIISTQITKLSNQLPYRRSEILTSLVNCCLPES